MNERFKAAADRVYAVLQPWFEQQDEERKDNLIGQARIIVELEELLQEERPDWFADEAHAIRKKWREAGPVPRDERAIEDRFREVCDTILGQR